MLLELEELEELELELRYAHVDKLQG